MGVVIGVDLGQRVDPTAIAVAEWERRERERHALIRHLERLPLGTSYPHVVTRLRSVVAGVVDRTQRRPLVYVDATGVGMPVVDLLREARLGADLRACFFTFGDHRTVANGEVRIGKAWLVSRLQALLQTGRIHLPQTSEAEALAQELLDYHINVDPDGDAKFGAFSVGAHDDLVTALGLACQDQTNGWEEFFAKELAAANARLQKPRPWG
jgi:terminase large subunit-like protein